MIDMDSAASEERAAAAATDAATTESARNETDAPRRADADVTDLLTAELMRLY